MLLLGYPSINYSSSWTMRNTLIHYIYYLILYFGILEEKNTSISGSHVLIQLLRGTNLPVLTKLVTDESICL